MELRVYARRGHNLGRRRVVRTVGLLHFQNASSLSAASSILIGFRASYATRTHDKDNEVE